MSLRIVHRYVGREVLVPFILGVVIFTFVLLMFQILKITEMVVQYGIAVTDVFLVLVYILPPFFVFTLPMAYLLAVILAVGRMSSDSELVALKAAGVSLTRIYPPILALSLAVGAATAVMTLKAESWGKERFREMLIETGRKHATLGIAAGVFQDRFEDFVIYVEEVDKKKNELDGIFIFDERIPEAPNIIVARKGRVAAAEDKEATLVIRLTDGAVHRTMKDPRAYEQATFSKYDVAIDVSRSFSADAPERSYLEMSVGDLKEHVARLRQEGEDEREMRRAWVEYHRRFAFPFACVVFGLIGMPLGVVPPRSGRGQGFTFAIVALCLYYLMFRVGENLGWKAVVHPFVAMWAPNALFAAIGFYLLWRKSEDREVWFLAAIVRAAARVRGLFRRRAGTRPER
ncbi:LPS export ABC transporter permease LptF [bacterium]|nr:LPS export ABC transporter permease LptF [bacterium]